MSFVHFEAFVDPSGRLGPLLRFLGGLGEAIASICIVEGIISRCDHRIIGSRDFHVNPRSTKMFDQLGMVHVMPFL
jgi:hypothetical protein